MNAVNTNKRYSFLMKDVLLRSMIHHTLIVNSETLSQVETTFWKSNVFNNFQVPLFLTTNVKTVM